MPITSPLEVTLHNTSVVPKEEGFCIDNWDLNNVTLENKYPTPLITDLFDRLGKAKYFTKMDLCKGYHHVCIT